MTMLHECRATHVLWVILTQNSVVTFVFKFDLRKSHSQVKLDQISKFKNFLQKHMYSRVEKEPTPHNQGGLPRLAGLAVLGG